MGLQSMKRAMQPLGIYRRNAENLTNELTVYADELELLYSEIDALIPEGFITTATGIGLKEYEELFGPEQASLSAETRRERLLKRMNLGEGDFTPAGIRKALDSFGLEYVIAEFPTLNRLNIVAQTDYTKAEQTFIKAEVEKIVPAHLEFQLVFNTLTWDELDARNKTFAQLDSDDLDWDQIDALD